MASLALPPWMRATHPIVRYEIRHWAGSRGWRIVRYLLWGGSLTFFLLPAACALIFGLSSQFTGRVEAILTFGGVFTAGLALVSVIAGLLNNLSASILGATLIARERESQTWPFLRLTSLTSIEIAGGKLMALLYTLSRPIFLVTALRVLAILSGLVTLLLAYGASGLNLPQVRELFSPVADEFTLSLLQWRAAELLGVVSILVALGAWLLDPFFGVLYNGLVGLTVSTLARSTGAAVVMVFAAHFILALGLYAPVQQVGSLILLPFAPSTTGAGATFIVTLAIILPFVLQTVLPIAVLVVCVLFTLRRVETLSE